MKLCIFCSKEIHPYRLEILPETKTCITCSQEKPKAGRLIIHGTGEEIYTELQIIDNETHVRLAELIENYRGDLLDELEDDIEES